MNFLKPSGTLNSAGEGVCLAERVLADSATSLDLSAVERMTSSFANALVMTLLAHIPESDVRRVCSFERCQPNVADALSRSFDRYARGLRLSSQRSTAVA